MRRTILTLTVAVPSPNSDDDTTADDLIRALVAAYPRTADVPFVLVEAEEE